MRGLSLPVGTCSAGNMRGGKLLLLTNGWDVDWTIERSPALRLSELGNVSLL